MKHDPTLDAIARCRSAIKGDLYASFASPTVVRRVLERLDVLVLEVAARGPVSELGLGALAARRRLGVLCASYEALSRAFGVPHAGDGVNVDALWVVVPDAGGLAVVHNWKNGRAYHGVDGIAIEAMTEWEVRGTSRGVLTWIEDAVSEAAAR